MTPEKEAAWNWELVAYLVRLIRDMGLEVATPAEARAILGTGDKSVM